MLNINRILIKDTVCFQIDESLKEIYPDSGGDGSEAAIRIQFEYDLLSGTITDLSINAFNEQDATDSIATIEKTKQGDLILRDLADMSLAVLKWQIELMFKSWKSICDIEKVKKVKRHRLRYY